MDDTTRRHLLYEAPAQKAGVSSFIATPSEETLTRAAQRLAKGELVAIPTETVYGLAADATQAEACRSIFAVKGRPLIDPLIIHVRDRERADRVAYFNPEAEALVKAFWPGALTLVLPKKSIVPNIVTAGRATVAVRCPAHPVFQSLVEKTDLPLAAPSANPFGYISPTRAEHVLRSFPHAGLLILDGGPCAIGLESTIVDLTDPARPRVLRAGHITSKQISSVLGLPVGFGPRSNETRSDASQPAPGMLDKHYSPHKRTVLGPADTSPPPSPSTARVYFQRPTLRPSSGPDRFFWLSETGDGTEAGRSLYHLLRQLDEDARWDRIWIEMPPKTPENAALLDRLIRASRP